MTPLQHALAQLPVRQPFLFPRQAVPDAFGCAAVLILFWEDKGVAHTLLTVRSQHLSSFAGQVCFPGGRLDPGEKFAQAALRETEEEVGIDRGDIDLVGRLDDAWSGGGYLMEPWVGYLARPPQTQANDEVARILTLPIDDDLVVDQETREHRGIAYMESVIHHAGERIFGLTADLLLEALEMLEQKNQRRGATRLDHLRQFAGLTAAP